MKKCLRKEKTLFELHPDLEQDLHDLRAWLKKEGLWEQYRITDW